MPNVALARPTALPVEEEVLRAASELVSELGTTPPSGTVRLEDSIDRDLGIGSLERVELLFRLEQRFGIRFPDHVMGQADSLGDVARAITATGSPAVERYSPAPAFRPGTSAPSSAGTVVDVLRWQVEAECRAGGGGRGVPGTLRHGRLLSQPKVTAAVLRDGWMDSGDLGYWADGELYITGRRKDMIKKAGRNLYPQELEEMVGDLPGIRKGCVAAFGVPDLDIGTERLVVVAESRQTAPVAAEQLQAAIRDRVVAAIGMPPDIVVVAGLGAVLKTSSGKIRRSATRDAYLRGDLRRRRASPRA